MKKYSWDLNAIYNDEDEFLKDYNKVLKKVNSFKKKYEGKLLSDGETLYNALDENEKIEVLLEKVYIYAYLNYYECTIDENNKQRIEMIDRLYSKINENSVWFINEINKITEAKYTKLKKQKEELQKYDFYILNILRNKKHKLSDKEEELISKLGLCFNNSSSVFSNLNDSDIKYDDIVVDGVSYELNHATYPILISSENRNIRKKAFINYFDYYKKHRNTLAELYISSVKANNKFSKIRNYDSELDKSLYEDNIDYSVFENIISVINKNLGLLQNYVLLRQKDLNIDNLNYYDLYTKGKNNTKYDITVGKTMLLDTFKVLGKDYTDLIKKAFDERWIDVYYKEGKRSGAFSWGGYDTYPYVLLNYNDDYDSVSTLAHELGHSINKYYSKEQEPIYADNPIFLAEIASTVNEFLLANYMLEKAEEKEEKKYILINILEHFRTTIFRQVLFTEFEKTVYDKDLNEEELTENILSNTYLSITKKYYGDTVEYFDGYKYEWSRIPHFYTPFYVYKYATGMSVACAIVTDILNKKENAVDNYKKFLRSGNKDFPLNILKECGYDLTKEDIFISAMELFRKYVEEYETLID